MSQAFSTVRVLDFSQIIAGPYATQLFNMLGRKSSRSNNLAQAIKCAR
jgi:crotonobetainyl-CoA:carnitine CoA-transferase CaiB-like acyl-CoA transferase